VPSVCFSAHIPTSELDKILNEGSLPHSHKKRVCKASNQLDASDLEIDPDFNLTVSLIPIKKKKVKEIIREHPEKTDDDFIYDEESMKYKCKICNRSLKTKQSVKNHKEIVCKVPKQLDASDVEIDEETKKYKCKECGKFFISLQTLNAHKRDICNKEPSQKCIFCDYKGRNFTILRVHIGRVHGKWPKLEANGTWSLNDYT
jgi:DNA-directed RNA polymerase subunit RPC12/RpoP